jgi:predicted RNA-binding protein with TRAM domain
MDIGDEYEVTIFDVAPNGEGVAKIKNYPVFIKNVKLNDRVKVRITSLNAGTADAELVP